MASQGEFWHRQWARRGTVIVAPASPFGGLPAVSPTTKPPAWSLGAPRMTLSSGLTSAAGGRFFIGGFDYPISTEPSMSTERSIPPTVSLTLASSTSPP